MNNKKIYLKLILIYFMINLSKLYCDVYSLDILNSQHGNWYWVTTNSNGNIIAITDYQGDVYLSTDSGNSWDLKSIDKP